MIAAIVLAAGSSSRMGRPKLLLRLGGKSLLRRTVDELERAPVDYIVVVLSGAVPELEAELAGTRARAVINPRYREGMSTSLLAGMEALPADTEAVVVTPADMPFLRAEAVARLVECFRRGSRPILVAEAGGIRGSPALFHRSVFPLVQQVTGDVGARDVVRQNPHLVEVITFEDPGMMRDVDTWDDFEAAEQSYRQRQTAEGRQP